MDDLNECLNTVSTLRGIAESIDDVIMCLTSTTDGTVLWVSRPGLRSILGYVPDEVVGEVGPSMLTGASDDRRFQDALGVVRAGATATGRYEARHKRGHGVVLRVTTWQLRGDVAVGLAVRDGTPDTAPEVRMPTGTVPAN